MIGDLHQNANGSITDRKNCFNALSQKYSEAEATKRGIKAASSQNFKEVYLAEKEKEVGVNSFNRPDFSDLGIGR